MQCHAQDDIPAAAARDCAGHGTTELGASQVLPHAPGFENAARREHHLEAEAMRRSREEVGSGLGYWWRVLFPQCYSCRGVCFV